MAQKAARSLRVALLKCERLSDHLPAEVHARTGGYLELLQQTFDHVTQSVKSKTYPETKVTFTGFDVKEQQYPKDVAAFDGVLITGSLSGVYDKDPWIAHLLKEIRGYAKHNVRTCGISFGHQAVAQALGGEVTRNPKGSEVAVRSVALTPDAQRYFKTRRKGFTLMYHHNDTISKLPPGFHSLGGNAVTEFQGLFQGENFLTFCGHPDYAHRPEALAALLEYDRQKLWVPEQLVEAGLRRLSRNPPRTDYHWVTRQIIEFYARPREKERKEKGSTKRGAKKA